MSGDLMTWMRRQVFKVFPEMKAQDRFTALMLADNGSWDEQTQTWLAWPSQETLAEDCNRSIRSVQRSLDQLEEDGIVVRKRRKKAGGAPGGHIYFFNIAVVANPIVKVGRLPVSPDMTLVSPLENSRHDKLSPTPVDPREFKTRQVVASVENDERHDTSVASRAR